MPVQVILDFESDADAKAFVKEVIENGLVEVGTHSRPGTTLEESDYAEATIVAAFKRPTKFCSCVKRGGWTRGHSYGWWVCDNCHRPTEKWTDNADRWRYALGINLIPAESGGIQPKKGERGDHDLESPKIWRDLPVRPAQGA
jgi:hypothetical protein